MTQMFDHSIDQAKDIAFPFFYVEAAVDIPATRANGGVPVFRDEHMVRIKIPGSKDEVCRPVSEDDKRRWPKIWEQYEKGIKQELDGTPLSEFSLSTAAERAALAQMGIQTVEQLAGLPDMAAIKANIIGVKNKAVKFLQTRAQFANVGKLQDELAALRKELEELKGGKNTDAAMSGGDGGNGIQPPVNIPEQPNARRKAASPVGEQSRHSPDKSP